MWHNGRRLRQEKDKLTTVLTDRGTHAVDDALVEGDALWLSESDLEHVTGWQLKPEGLCKGAVCVPIPPGQEAAFVARGQVNVAALWRHTGQPVATSANGDVWCLGTSADDRNASLSSLDAPNFTLPDFSGHYHSLSDFQRKKVLLITWASW